MDSYYANKTKELLNEFNSQFNVLHGKSISPNLNFKINCIDNRVVYCHKKILMKCSNFFRNMEETVGNLCEINWNDGEIKCTFDTVCTLLKLLYGKENKNIKFVFDSKGYLFDNNINQHIEVFIIMDMLELEKYMENMILKKIVNTYIAFRTRKHTHNIIIEYSTYISKEFSDNQLIMVRGLSLESIITLPIYEQQYLSNRYMRTLRRKILSMGISYYSEKLIGEYIKIYIQDKQKSKLIVDNILECEDILEEVRDDIRLIVDVFAKFVL